ncbi:ABC transporter ATP-binding protein [Caulobacter sp. KR2-114]|uniref:ABC transporter ATP-binding protein n=1 Tax=Caulobacter sp. KR2-114 TaxID=3400912 RepID=UPI003BFD2203
MTPDPQVPILQVEQVVHAYGGTPVLRGVDLTIRAGEIYALLGPNGAGKTTLIRAICGRLKPSGGRVRLAGGDPQAEPAVRACLGLAPQELALYAHLTVRENLEVFASLSGLKRAEVAPAVEAAMAVTRTADRAHVPVRHLSGGYQRRVNIAAAVLHHPRLLILDEPTVGVDINAREAVDAVIRALAEQGVAVLLITHDLEQAGGLATRVGFLSEGRKVLEGEPAALIADAFGEHVEVLVVVAADLAAHEEERVRALGLERGRATDVWTCLADDGYAAAARLDKALKAVGLPAREIRVRQPSLQNLFSLISEDRRAA